MDRFLPGSHSRGKFMRYDTAVILKRFFLCEQALIIGQAGWLPGIPYFEVKTMLPKILWQDAITAHELRNRVFELRFPSRMLEIGDDEVLINFIRQSYQAPTALAFLMGLSRVFKPSLEQAYKNYLILADEIGDGPTYRFLKLAIKEKAKQIEQIEKWICQHLQYEEEENIKQALKWVDELKDIMNQLNGIGIDAPKTISFSLSNNQYFAPSEIVQRDNQFKNVRFYWPDIVDDFPYGDGIKLQLRSAVSHLNEIWAVENAGFILYSFADELGWDFIHDAARWVYDESRHCIMGYERLKEWGFKPNEIPLGTFIMDSCIGQDPIYRLGMLFYFESKNIRKKPERTKSFAQFNDRVSQHDMDFDWADETIHTSYGKRWLSKILEIRGQDPNDYQKIGETCNNLVKQVVQSVTQNEINEITNIAKSMIEKAEQLAGK